MIDIACSAGECERLSTWKHVVPLLWVPCEKKIPHCTFSTCLILSVPSACSHYVGMPISEEHRQIWEVCVQC